MALQVAINGFGRIGRCFARAVANDPDIDIVAINDLGDSKNLAYLLKYDTVYRKASFEVSAGDKVLTIGKNKVHFLQEKDPAQLPWADTWIESSIGNALSALTTMVKKNNPLTRVWDCAQKIDYPLSGEAHGIQS